MERAKTILEKIASPKLYAEHTFEFCGTKGTIVCSVVNSDSAMLLEIIKRIKECSHAAGCKVDYEFLREEVMANFEMSVTYSPDKEMTALLGGDGLMYLDSVEGCLILNVRKYTVRAVAEPPTTGIIKGPREGFIEDMRTNLSLITRRLKTADLKVEQLTIGRRTGAIVSVIYIDGIAKPEIAAKIYDRLRSIDVDGAIGSHFLREYLEERPGSIFAQSGSTEKPDELAARLLEGRIAVLLEGSPIAITLPYILWEDVQSGEDYYERPTFTTLLRFVRLFALLVGIVLPGLFVALQEYHFDIIPLGLLLTISQATQGVPFQPFGEVLFVLFLFEMIRESGVRMPQALGLAMSIVGALVLGDTAVKAGFIGSTSVMIVALSSVSLYTVPNTVGSSSILRMAFTVVAGIAGLYGMLIMTMFLLAYICNLDSYGSPYLAPFAPFMPSDQKDGLIRVPSPEMHLRPSSIPSDNVRRSAESNDIEY